MMIGNALPKSLQDNPELGCWVSFDRPGLIGVGSGKVELGQGILTALAQIAADELAVDPVLVALLPVDTDSAPDEGITAGSQSVEVSGASIRLALAQARSALVDAAATRLGADVASLSCRDGAILIDGQPTGLDYWMLAADVDWRQHVTGNVPAMPVGAYSAVGASQPRIDMAQKRGGAGFIHDLSLAGMLHVRVIRQPFRLACLADVDMAWLQRRYPGVRAVRKNDFLALVAADEHAVHSAHGEAEKFARWEEVAGLWQPAATSGEKITVLGAAAPHAGSPGIAARYSRQHVAHASIGPSCALAQFDAGRLTVWSHSQGIFPLRGQIAKCLGLDPSMVRVIHAHGSGSYGHNGADDVALDAAIVAMEMPGQPVRVQWSREDELSRGPLGAAMSASVEAELDSGGQVASWKLSVVSAPHAQRPGFGGHFNLSSAEALDGARLPQKVDDLPDAAGGGAARNSVAIYDFPGQEVAVRLDTASRIRTSSLRSLGAHLNVFAIESAVDELADLAGADPLDFRLRHLSDDRCRAVLQGVADMSGWPGSHPAGEGRAFGIAAARYKNKGAWLAAVAEVSVDEEIRLERLWLCADIGLVINPEGARSQIEGGAIQAASWTLKEEVRVEDDRVPAFDWSAYPILKFSEIPEIETRFIVDPARPPLGAGEASQGPVAAAIGNAASRALGLRMRDLPLTRDRLVEALMGA
ncbi:molybdopterin cofactor-binding domain-containing protein [Aminobacter aganoensis]|uniref:CO/xanthine dehydrogenase Mo-binding subunit n=1 Tax=Aminobacter aganoensis TaxID=83264 RepID=A0A7X0F791_9HYPH|nr:molybdopterin cofactor-binding domain-containing protein [Aminobacter aganoensis]MBB6354295.1 CO/xanthine dehydrogenase Mo-binding subunit [Aminobacter aganoensis]